MNESKDTIDQFRVPPLPAVFIRVLQYDPSSKDSGTHEMEAIISPDKSICAEVLRVANSAFYGRSGKVTTLKDAITLLGLKSVKNLIILLQSKVINKNLRLELLRKYSNEVPVLTALIAHDLCKIVEKESYRDDAFVAGLLHGIGNSILAMNKALEYYNILNKYEKEGGSLIDLEKTAFQTDHTELGEKVFRLWKLPEQYSVMVANYMFPPDKVSDMSDLTRITSLAGFLARKLEGLRVDSAAEERAKAIMQFYQAEDKVNTTFNENYFQALKLHPFYEQVMAS